MKNIRKLLRKIEPKYFIFFLIALFFIKIPPFYIFFPIKSSFLTTHVFARAASLLLFFLVLLKILLSSRKEKILDKKDKILFGLFVVYLFFHSIPVISAQDITSYLRIYKDLVFPGFFLFLALLFKKNREKYVFVIILASVFNFFYQMFMFWEPSLFKTIGSQVIYASHFKLVDIDLNRSRLFTETFDEIAIPLLFFLMLRQKTWKKRLGILSLILLVAIPSLLSNFRSRIFMLAVAFVLSFIFITGKRIKTSLSILAPLAITGFVCVLLLDSIFHFSFVDRILLRDPHEDVQTITSRVEDIQTSSDVAQAYPLTGVGMGNYFLYLSPVKRYITNLAPWLGEEVKIASQNPHNVFAQEAEEAGILNLIFYSGMLGYFILIDFRKLRSKRRDKLSVAFAISFWTLFAYALFNPVTTISYNTLFWLLRALAI